jgi:hypothetical protein
MVRGEINDFRVMIRRFHFRVSSGGCVGVDVLYAHSDAIIRFDSVIYALRKELS